MAEQYLAEPMVEEAYQDLARTILEHNPGVHLDRVRAAFEVADRAHGGQRRKQREDKKVSAFQPLDLSAFQSIAAIAAPTIGASSTCGVMA